MNDNFDKKLYGLLNSRANVSPEKNITEAAIVEASRKIERNGKVKNMRLSVRIASIAVCSVVIAFTGMMAFSEDLRNDASNIIQTIFTLDKEGDSYKIVERNPAEEMTALNFGGIPIEEFDRNELIDKLGFEPLSLEKVGEYQKVSADLGMGLYGKSSDQMQLSNDDLTTMLRNYPNDERFQRFIKQAYFSMMFSKSGGFSDDYTLFIRMGKTLKKPFSDDSTFVEKISQFTYKGVECSYNAKVSADYQRIFDRQFIYDDKTKQPKGVIKSKHIEFDIDGLSFVAGYIKAGVIDLSAFDYDVTQKFVKDFIDAYKSMQ